MAALCLAAAARVGFGAAALPFFADTDEYAHFDVVHKLARGCWPSGSLTALDVDVIRLRIYDSSPEYMTPPEAYVLGRFPPPVRDWPDDKRKKDHVAAALARCLTQPNYEEHEPPAYYALAAAWYRLGRAFGISGAASVYWVRFLNVPLYAALVALSYGFARRYFGRDVGLAVASLTAFYANTIFFTVSNDVLSPLAGVASLTLLLRWYERPGPLAGAAAGTMTAAAVLVKLTNAAALVAAAAVVLLRARRVGRPGKAMAESWTLLLCAALPLLAWGARNRLALGEWSGTGAKAAFWGMTPKPVSALLDHPLFTANGPPVFLRTLSVSFFWGDAHWHRGITDFQPSKVFFLVTAAALPAAALAAACRRGWHEPGERLAVGVSALVVVASVAELAFLSLLVDFGRSPFPSRQFPFFSIGRLAGGALVPFLTLYAYGAKALAGRRSRLLALVVAVAVVLMILGQAVYLNPTVSSRYNWFHLP
jgi:hypothetical protein